MFFRFENKYALPNFIIIGVQKGGTTSLWFNLRKHPGIEMAPNFRSYWWNGKVNKKEIHFFDSEFNRGAEWYKKQFNNNGKIQGEATPDYIVDNLYHKRMFSIAPKAKLIITLRDPVTRAHSAFNHFLQEEYMSHINYSPKLSFEENLIIDEKDQFRNGIIRYGFYMDQIEDLLKYYPRGQILIIISERLKEKPKETYRKLFDFLGAKRIKIEIEPNIGKREYPSPLEENLKKKLYKIYKSYNERLFNFLGYRIKEWEDPYL